MQTISVKNAFLVIFLLLMLCFIAIIRPFLLPALFAMLIAVICGPIYRRVLKFCKNKRYLASFFATLFVTICVLVPLGIAIAVIIANMNDVVAHIMRQIEAGNISVELDKLNIWLNAKRDVLLVFLPENFDIKRTLLTAFSSIGKTIYQYSPKVISATASVFGGVLLTIVFIFIFFAEGSRLYQTLFDIFPLAKEHKELMAKDIRGVIAGTFVGQIATSVAQGLLIGLGFWIAGIANPAIWGLVAIGVTLIPIIGGPLMYIPAGIALLIEGSTGSGIFILLYGVGVVSVVDNIIKPLVMRGKVNIHPLLLALSLIGGTMWMGPAGIILGPLVVVLMMAMLKIYQREQTA